MSDPVAHQGPAASGTTSADGNVEYRVAHLHDRLAAEELGELGVRAEIRAGAIVITGTVPSARCRETLLRIAREELAGLTVHTDVVVAETTGPDHAEEL
ncbi:BON domain-containing protein [Streptomyces lancefieldiae]|uniref:BON domain-containing protein n=1 Tax=Streptomyces lancefieldiae TaxID=3075520 RepID=A0ABU3AH65_9ACTN|nr:BON domain-containing protein [Streptomyces sp. DSM 40712]MDT0609314.1 BON domain-containing protein [Streptomyces sp. DSM 40712]